MEDKSQRKTHPVFTFTKIRIQDTVQNFQPYRKYVENQLNVPLFRQKHPTRSDYLNWARVHKLGDLWRTLKNDISLRVISGSLMSV